MRRLSLLLACVIEAGWLMVGGASPRLTESPQFTDAMFASLPPVWGWSDALRRTSTPESAAKLVFVAGLLLACAAYTAVSITLLRTELKRPYVWIALGGVVFSTTLVLSPGLLSTDAVMYAVYGRMATVHGLNPYLSVPANIGGDRLLEWTGRTPSYATVASVYGPLWTWLSAGLAVLTVQMAPLGQVLPYRLLGLLAHAVNAYLVWCLARRLAPETPPAAAVLLYAWNPLVLFELVGSGHNDGFMLSLVLAGLLLAVDRRLLGAAVMWCGVLVKWVPVLAVSLLVSATIQASRGWTLRVRSLALLGAVFSILTLVTFAPWLDLRDIGVLRASTTLGGERYVNAPLDVPTAWLASHVVDRGGNDVAAAQRLVRQWTFGVARLLLLAYVMLEAVRLWRTRGTLQSVLEASVRTLFAVLLLGATQVLAWYFTWPLALAAPLGARHNLARLAVAYSVLYLPIFYVLHEDMLPTTVASALILSFAVVPLLALRFVRREPAAHARVVEGAAA